MIHISDHPAPEHKMKRPERTAPPETQNSDSLHPLIIRTHGPSVKQHIWIYKTPK